MQIHNYFSKKNIYLHRLVSGFIYKIDFAPYKRHGVILTNNNQNNRNMKRIANLLLAGVLAMVLATSCEPANNGTSSEKPVLNADKTLIAADGKETVTFTVFSGEEDVTAEARVFLASDNSELINKTFSTTEMGDYQFYATYNDMSSDYVKVSVSNLQLSADKESIVADGEETVTFTLMQGETDMTTECTFYLVSEDGEDIALEGNTFTTTEAGNHNIYAAKNDAISNTVSIFATPTSTPTAWNFRERSLLIEVTGTWCGPCSIMKAGIKSLEQEGWDEGHVTEAHVGDALTVNSIINQVATFIGYTGSVPLVTFNFADTPRQQGHGGSVAASATLIRNLTDQANSAYPCTAGATALFSSTDENTLNVTSNIAISEDGEYKVCCWLLENNIKATQTTQPGASEWDIHNHINVLRQVSDVSDIAGQAVTAGPTKLRNSHGHSMFPT